MSDKNKPIAWNRVLIIALIAAIIYLMFRDGSSSPTVSESESIVQIASDSLKDFLRNFSLSNIFNNINICNNGGEACRVGVFLGVVIGLVAIVKIIFGK